MKNENSAFDIILSPVITEKSTNLNALNKLTFKVSKDIKITSEEGIVIYGDELRGDNKDRIYTIEKNVIVNDNINNIQFKSNKIIYNQTLNVITLPRQNENSC